MKTRVIVAAICLPLLLAIVLLLPPWCTAALQAILCAIGAYELLFRAKQAPHVRLVIYSAVTAAAICVWNVTGQSGLYLRIVLFLFIVALFGELLAGHTKLQFREVAVCLFAGLGYPYFFSAITRILVMEQGRFLVLLPFVLTMIPDSGAYFFGRAFGKHKMSPIISPHKTVEGAVGAVITGIIGMMIYGLILKTAFSFEVNFLLCAVYGVLGAGGSIMGDLAFSVIKRQQGIKDYGNLLPGHGGVLDRFDSTMVVAPMCELLLLILPFAVK